MHLRHLCHGARTLGRRRPRLGQVRRARVPHLELNSGCSHREQCLDQFEGCRLHRSGVRRQNEERIGSIEHRKHFTVPAGDSALSPKDLSDSQIRTDTVEFGDGHTIDDGWIPGDLARPTGALTGEDHQGSVRRHVCDQRRESSADFGKWPDQHVAKGGDQ